MFIRYPRVSTWPMGISLKKVKTHGFNSIVESKVTALASVRKVGIRKVALPNGMVEDSENEKNDEISHNERQNVVECLGLIQNYK